MICRRITLEETTSLEDASSRVDWSRVPAFNLRDRMPPLVRLAIERHRRRLVEQRGYGKVCDREFNDIKHTCLNWPYQFKQKRNLFSAY